MEEMCPDLHFWVIALHVFDDEEDGNSMFDVVAWDEGVHSVEEEHKCLNLRKIRNRDM